MTVPSPAGSDQTVREWTEIKRQRLNSAFVKLRARRPEVVLYQHEADALYEEFVRLANFATLLGEPSPAEMAGIFTREEIDARHKAFIAGDKTVLTPPEVSR